MKRDVAALANGPFDLLVIGGGIYGAWIAYDAALRGLRVALVEQNDWASGTSSASSKLIHGGLRYLEYGWLNLVRKSLRERGRLLHLAPHRVQPLRFLLPVYEGDRAGPLKLKAGLTIYDLLAGQFRMQGHRQMTPEQMLHECPFLYDRNLVAGFAYSDCGEDDARFTLEVVAGAVQAGAVAVNGVRVNALLRTGDTVHGAAVLDQESRRTFEVQARMTVNATGAWGVHLADLQKRYGGAVRYTKGAHLVMPKMPISEALLLTAASDKRVFFLIPWYGTTLLGTTDTDYRGDPAKVRVEPEDIDYLLHEAVMHCPGLEWHLGKIRGEFAGLRTLRSADARHPSAVNREWSLDEPLQNLLFPIGGKFTSARVEADQTVSRIMYRLKLPAVRCPTALRPFPWKPEHNWKQWSMLQQTNGRALGLDVETAATCVRRFGTTVKSLYAIIRERPELAQRIVPDLPFCKAEIAHGAANEMARTLSDLLRRRIPLSILSRLTPEMISEAADLARPILGWTSLRREQEIASLRDAH